MNVDSKVIAFETLQIRQRENAKHSPNRVFVQGRSIFIKGAAERMARFFTKADDELFRLSENASNSVLQSHYFSNMRYLRRERGILQARYLRDLTDVYEAFWRNTPLPDLGQKKALDGFGELALLEDELFEESLAINGMVEKGDSLFYKELQALDRRFMALLGKPDGVIELNPISPLVLCRLFAMALADLGFEFKIKLLIFKLFDKYVLSTFGAVYHEMNAQMAKAGILPCLAKAVKQPKFPRDARASQPAQRFIKENDRSRLADGVAAFEGMRILMEAWRCRLGLPHQAAGHGNGARVANSAEVLSVLSLLQQPSKVLMANGKVLPGEQMKRLIASQIARFHAGGKKPPLDRQVEDIIDMVGMIFVYILEDRHLPASVKALLASLQIPILKVALLEKSFFAQKNHPARLLLNSLAQAGMGLDGDIESDRPVFQKIESVVERILARLDRDIALFYELLEDFTAFMAIEGRRNRAAEERTRQATQSKEHVRLAKREVAYVIASRLRGLSAPPILRSFLYNAWKDVLVLACLRRDKDAENWDSAVSLMDQLIGITRLWHEGDASAQVERGVPFLLDTMRHRLENLAYEQHGIMALFKALGACYGHPAAQSEPAACCRPVDGFDIKDSEFAELVREIEDCLSKGAALEKVGGGHLDAQGLARVAVPAGLEVGGEDEFSSKAGSLGVGQWIEFTEGQQVVRRAKLSWKSRESEVYIFVNARGAKVMELQRADLACCLRLGGARIIEDSTIPLMDRALSRLMHSLENPSDGCVP